MKCYPVELAKRIEDLLECAAVAHTTQQTEYVEVEAYAILCILKGVEQ